MLGKKIIDVLGIDVSGMRRNEIHVDATSIEKVINFTLTEFSRLKAPNKIIVLQYSEKDMPKLSKEVASIKKQVISLASQFGFTIVDTFDKVKSEHMLESPEVWNGHHTAHGNELVCREILKKLN